MERFNIKIRFLDLLKFRNTFQNNNKQKLMNA